MEDAASKHASKNQAFRLWIETQDDLIKSPSIQDPKAINNNAFLLFLKYFDAKNQCLKGFGTMYVRKQDKVGDLIKPLCEAMGWSEKMGIKLFEVRYARADWR
jgi:ubiquitin carboxyl-terminal hydrolase 7